MQIETFCHYSRGVKVFGCEKGGGKLLGGLSNAQHLLVRVKKRVDPLEDVLLSLLSRFLRRLYKSANGLWKSSSILIFLIAATAREP